jgi:hypothetical protein
MRSSAERLRVFWGELRRRKVFSVGAAYLVAAWGASVGAAELMPAFGAPDWAVRAFIISAALGFPVAVLLAWAFELTPGGVVKDDGGARLAAGDTLTRSVAAGSLAVTWEDSTGLHSKRFERGFLIGRDPACELWIDDPMVSRRHARIRLERGVWLIEDLGSRNGTRVDGNLVDQFALPRRAEVRLYPAGPPLRIELEQSGATTVRALTPGEVTRLSDPPG